MGRHQLHLNGAHDGAHNIVKAQHYASKYQKTGGGCQHKDEVGSPEEGNEDIQRFLAADFVCQHTRRQAKDQGGQRRPCHHSPQDIAIGAFHLLREHLGEGQDEAKGQSVKRADDQPPLRDWVAF